MIDTGGSLTNQGNLSNNTTIPLLKSYGINKIHYLILTHGDADHMGEASNIVNNLKVETVIFNCGNKNNMEKELINAVKEAKVLSFFKNICIYYNDIHMKQSLRRILANASSRTMAIKNILQRRCCVELESDDLNRMCELITAFLNKSNYRKHIDNEIK